MESAGLTKPTPGRTVLSSSMESSPELGYRHCGVVETETLKSIRDARGHPHAGAMYLLFTRPFEHNDDPVESL
jgi:hypothetical protein